MIAMAILDLSYLLENFWYEKLISCYVYMIVDMSIYDAHESNNCM